MDTMRLEVIVSIILKVFIKVEFKTCVFDPGRSKKSEFLFSFCEVERDV